MKRVRRGFTLIEVSLFLVITAAVFVGVAVGTQNSIFQQRYNDAVQNYVEFLRTVYSQVTNVQSESTGRSGWAIYGKLVTFNRNDEGGNAINSYNVIGRIGNASEGDVLRKLADLDANAVMDDKPVGFVENYTPRWASQIQNTDAWNETEGEDRGYRLFTGALLIVRSPNTGTVYTYIYKYEYDPNTVEGDAINVDGAIAANRNPFSYTKDGVEKNRLTDGSFKQENVDFCLNPNGAERSTLRRDIRIIKDARNASGIEIISDDDSECGS